MISGCHPISSEDQGKIEARVGERRFQRNRGLADVDDPHRSIGLFYLGGSDHLAPTRQLSLDPVAEFRRRATAGIAATTLATAQPTVGNTVTVTNATGITVGQYVTAPGVAAGTRVGAISGNTITLDKKLDYMHFGKITFDVDERGEVGLLTRNVKVQASEDAAQTYFGGHIMAMVTSKMYVEGVELNRMGQHLELARYPIHWHLVGDAGKGQYIKNASIHDTFNRCVTVHGTNDVRVENNVTYNIVGHCFFLEDAVEHGNQFVHNLAIQIKCHPTRPCVPYNTAANGEVDADRRGLRQISFSGKDTLLPSDNTVSAYWITNPDNSFIDNVAAGSDETGFWFSLPMHPQGAFAGSDIAKKIWPRRTPVRIFRGNVSWAHF